MWLMSHRFGQTGSRMPAGAIAWAAHLKLANVRFTRRGNLAASDDFFDDRVS